MAVYPVSAATNADLSVAVNNVSTLLDGAIDDITTTVVLADASLFPTAGYVSIDLEIIRYTGKAVNTLTGVTRGADGTTAASHANGSFVGHNTIAAHHNALKDEIIAIETDLGARLGFNFTNLRAVAGSAASPAFTFASDPDNGMYNPATNELGFSTNGTERVRVLSNGAVGLGTSPNVDFHVRNTTVDANVWLSTHNDAQQWLMGVRGDTGDEFQIIDNTGGTDVRLAITPAGIVRITGSVENGDGSAALPSYSFVNNTDTGIYRVGADELGFATGGTHRVSVDSGGDLNIGSGAHSHHLSIIRGTPTIGLSDTGGNSNNFVTFTVSDGALEISLDPNNVSGNSNLTFLADGATLKTILSNGIISQPQQSFVSAHASALTTIPGTGTDTKVTFGTELLDRRSEFASSTFTAGSAGEYEVHSKILYASPATGRWITKLYKNGSPFVNLDTQFIAAGASDVQVGGSYSINLAANDTLEIYANQNSGVSEDTIVASSTFFIVSKIN